MTVRRWRPGLTRKQSDQRWMRSAIPNMFDGISPNPMPIFRTGADQAMLDQSSATAPGSMLNHYAEILKPEGEAPAGTYQTTYYPLPYWPHVVAGGVPQTPGVDYSLDGRTLTIESPMNLHTSEELWIRYDYADAGVGRDPFEGGIYVGFDSWGQPNHDLVVADLEAGDLIIFFASGSSDTPDSFDPAYSWTELTLTNPFGGGIHRMAWRIADGTETGGIQYVADGGIFSRFCSGMIVFRNVVIMDQDDLFYTDTSPVAIPVLSGLMDGEIACYVGFGSSSVISGSVGTPDTPYLNGGGDSSSSGKDNFVTQYYLNDTGSTISTPADTVGSSGSDPKAWVWMFRLGEAP